MPRTREFKLVGPHAGKTIVLGSFSFVGGSIHVNEKEVESVAPIIERFYSSAPAEEWEKAQGEYERENKVRAEDSALPSRREAAKKTEQKTEPQK